MEWLGCRGGPARCGLAVEQNRTKLRKARRCMNGSVLEPTPSSKAVGGRSLVRALMRRRVSLLRDGEPVNCSPQDGQPERPNEA